MATSTLTLRTVINSTRDVAQDSGIGYKRETREQDFTHATTTASATYTTALTSISSEIYTYIAGLSGTVSFIHGFISITNSTAVATPFGYSSKVSNYSTADANEAEARTADAYTAHFELGPGDYSSAATLKTALAAQFASAVALTPYS